MARRVVVVSCFLCLLAWPAAAQQGTADVRGKVVDQQGAVLPGVTVVVRNQDSGLFRESVTGPDGLFLMSAMTPGMYEVAAELAGFKKVLAARHPARSRAHGAGRAASSKWAA